MIGEATRKGGEPRSCMPSAWPADPGALSGLAAEWDQIRIKTATTQGKPDEKAAMSFHDGTLRRAGPDPSAPVSCRDRGMVDSRPGYGTARCQPCASTRAQPAQSCVLLVNGRGRAPARRLPTLARRDAPQRNYRAALSRPN